MSHIPGAVDVRVQQPFDSPRMNLVVDRTQASQLGITENQVAGALLGALSGSTQVSPNSGSILRMVLFTARPLLEPVWKLHILAASRLTINWIMAIRIPALVRMSGIELGPIQIADCQSFRFRPVREYNNFTDMTALRPNARGW
jgi:Cu/Ag efflux pump CusA